MTTRIPIMMLLGLQPPHRPARPVPRQRIEAENRPPPPIPRRTEQALAVLRKHGPMRVTEFADRLFVSKKTAQNLLRAMLAHGIVAKKRMTPPKLTAFHVWGLPEQIEDLNR